LSNNLVRLTISQVFYFFLWLELPFSIHAQVQDVVITVHLRGVTESKVSLLGQSGSKIFKTIAEVKGLHDRETSTILVSKEILPGEFVLRFDYKEKETSTPYPSEKYIFISDQDLELWLNPMYCNNPDSAWFQKDERENRTFAMFSEENARRKEKLALLQNFLMNYDDPNSDFYTQGITEYENRRTSYNQWLTDWILKDKDLFVSLLYRFEFIQEISWKGTVADRIRNLISHYFDYMDFNSSKLIKLSELNKWMDSYVNLYGELSTTVTLRDSLFPEAGRTAIEKARKGNPLVYGWMVDYFYRGFETNGITAGMKILEPYLNDPNCLTSKRVEIARRLDGMKTFIPGSKAPNITLKDLEGNLFDLYSSELQCKFILVLFWSAGCSHCTEMVDKLYPWQQQNEVRQKINVIAISLDETENEIKLWKHKITELKGWKHLDETGGINSKVAQDYFVLSTPVMVLIDAGTKDIIAVPDTVEELIKVMKLQVSDK
jgi:thioredoxin-related protein